MYNIFLYWVGKEFKLIKILRKLIYLNSGNYKIHLLNHDNVKQYIDNISPYFFTMLPAFQADYVRIKVILKYGGIWLDSDTLVISNLDPLFDFLNTHDGFFVLQNNFQLCNGVFGSKPNTPLMIEVDKQLCNIVESKKGKVRWIEIGGDILEQLRKKEPEYYKNYTILNGLDNIYPVNWIDCESEYLDKPYDNYKNLVREFQPLIILVNKIYRRCENLSETQILDGRLPLNYFITKAFNNSGIYDIVDYYFKQNMFENIYNDKIWNNGDMSIPLSGPGSSIFFTTHISQQLDSFVREYKCDSVLDLGCGDLTWISRTSMFNDKNISYIGIDIVPSIIESHKKMYPHNKFFVNDITCSVLPRCSLIIIRDVLFHMKNNDILRLFDNIKGKFNYIAITCCTNTINLDDFHNKWHFSPRNILCEPFNKSKNYMVKIDEPIFDRSFLIYDHNSFY